MPPHDDADTADSSDTAAAPLGRPLRLGEWLRAERLRRGFTYEEIARDTRINRAYLEALETEHFDVIPAPVNTRGFLRSYARALGLDPEAAIAMLPTDLPRPPGLEPSPSLRRHTSEPPAVSLPVLPSIRLPSMRLPSMARLTGARDAQQARGAQHNRGLSGLYLLALRPWRLAAGGIALLVLAALYIPPLFSGGATSAPTTPAGTASTPAPGGAPGAAQPSATSTPAGQPGSAGRMPNLVGMQQPAAQQTLQAQGLTWVTVEIASTTSPAGTVVGQSPTDAAAVNRGDNVTLIVSRGAPR